MGDIVLSSINGKELQKAVSTIGLTTWVESCDAKIHRFRDIVTITSLRNALSRGEVCPVYSFTCDDGVEGLVGYFVNQHRSLPDIIESLWFGINFDDKGRAISKRNAQASTVNISVRYHKAINMFSPFAVYKPNRLATAPKLWTRQHVIRALLNGQCKNVKCTSKTTDDSLEDSERNFYKGFLDRVAFARKLIEDGSSSWRFGEGGNGVVHADCSTFNYNQFDFYLEGSADGSC